MSACHERVLAALELKEPDRVPTMDVMEEISNVYEVLGKKPLPFGQLFRNRHTGRVIPFTLLDIFSTSPHDAGLGEGVLLYI